MAVVASITLSFVCDSPVLANGSKAKRLRYSATVQTGDGPDKTCQFDADLEPLLFRLTTVRDKYRLVRIAIRNSGDRKLMLSRAADRMEMDLASGRRPVILDLGAHDPGFWDSLPADVRTALAYPPSVDAREERSVFVFIPMAEAAPPQAFHYTIGSLSTGPVVIRDTTPVSRH